MAGAKIMSLLGGSVEVVMHDVEEPLADDYFLEIKAEGMRLQRIFDFYDPKSELSLLNGKRRLKVSDEMVEVVGKGLMYAQETGGRYDISIGRRIIARKQGKLLPDVSCSYRDVEVDGNSISLTHPDVLLDLGSIAKGYIGDKIVEFMKRRGVESGFVDARGDMRTYGSHPERVVVQHPRDKSRTLRPMLLRNLAVATSGDYVQYHGSFDKSHIIGDTDFISVTVVAKELADADAIATCVFVLGSSEAGKFLSKRKDIKVYAIDRGMGEHAYNEFRSLLLAGAKNAF